MLTALRRNISRSVAMAEIDPAVAKLLQLDPATTTVSSHGAGGMSAASTAKISTTLADGKQKMYFMKTAKGKEAEVMFRGIQQALKDGGSQAEIV